MLVSTAMQINQSALESKTLNLRSQSQHTSRHYSITPNLLLAESPSSMFRDAKLLLSDMSPYTSRNRNSEHEAMGWGTHQSMFRSRVRNSSRSTTEGRLTTDVDNGTTV